MSRTTHQSTSDGGNMSNQSTDVADFTALVAEMVADQAPRLFAVVLELGEQIDGQIVAWGMALDDYTYMITADGKNQYILTEPDNALRYVPSRPGITPHLIWADPSAPPHHQ